MRRCGSLWLGLWIAGACSLERTPLHEASRVHQPAQFEAGNGGGSTGGTSGIDTSTGGSSGVGGSAGTSGTGGSGGASGAAGSGGTSGAGGSSGAPADPGCKVHCDDAVFCNGLELCAPNEPTADADGCMKVPPKCQAGQSCDEGMLRCVTDCAKIADADGDGHDAVDCGGEDCDDAIGQINPDAVDLCNGFDDDCSGAVDDGLAAFACLLPSAAGVCNAGHCEVVSCLEGAQDCDGSHANGCELVDNSPGDCKHKNCAGKLVTNDADQPLDDGEECTIEACSSGSPVVSDAPNGTGCGDGGECDGGSCVESG